MLSGGHWVLSSLPLAGLEIPDPAGDSAHRWRWGLDIAINGHLKIGMGGYIHVNPDKQLHM